LKLTSPAHNYEVPLLAMAVEEYIFMVGQSVWHTLLFLVVGWWWWW